MRAQAEPAAAAPRGMALVDLRAILRKSIQAARGLFLRIMTHISLIQCLTPAFSAPRRRSLLNRAAARQDPGTVMRWDRDGSKTPREDLARTIRSGLAGPAQAFDII